MNATWNRIEIAGLTADSRRVEKGYLFAALPGANTDGRSFVSDALAKGAAAVLAPSGSKLKETLGEIPLIEDALPRRRLALMAARFYGAQPKTIAAVTGTSGKTSTATFTRQIWQLLGMKAASLGTLGLEPAHAGAPKSLTTPDPIELHACLADLAKDGVDHLVMEASSHGLDQFRLDGVVLKAAAFTNLSRDHLDYHPDMASYLAAKRRLFQQLLSKDGVAVLNADAPEFATLRADCDKRGITVLDFGRRAKALQLVDWSAEQAGQTLTLDLLGHKANVTLPLIGAFQAENILAAIGLVMAEGLPADQIIAALPKLTTVPGRMEFVGNSATGGAVFVDYAHKPAALESVLSAARAHTQGQLWVIVGCGGDRDPGKRPMMGAIAARLADQVIITDDNPRSEDPAAIRRAMLITAREIAPDTQEFDDRGTAIARAVAGLAPGDVLVIAGKGHESGQIVGVTILPFDDRDVARTAIAATTTGGGDAP